MANRPSRLVVPVYVPSYDGRYYGRWPHGDKPNSGALLEGDSIARSVGSGSISAAIRMLGGAVDRASSAGGLSTAVRLTAAAQARPSGSATAADTGGGAAPSGNTGINVSTQTVTAPYWRLDLGQSGFIGSNVQWLSGEVGGATLVRQGTCTFNPTGGPFGRGYHRFIPGSYTTTINNPRGEHYNGVGQIHGFAAASPDPTRITIGMMVRYGSGYMTEGQSGKEIILLRSIGARPMIIPKIGSQTTILAACDGTVCNANATLIPREYGNDSNSIPDQELLYGHWQYTEMSVSTASPGAIRVKVWDDQEIYSGQFIFSDLNEGAGGNITDLDIINFMTSVTSPTVHCYKDIAYVEGWLGTVTDRGPPAGFPGSFR